MVTEDMPAVMQDTSSSFVKPAEMQSLGDRPRSGLDDDYYPDSASHSPSEIAETLDNDESMYVDSSSVTGPAAVSIDSAQHLLQSISSDDEGSRSPSPVRRSPGPAATNFSPPGSDRSPEDNILPQMPNLSVPVTMDDICNCDDSKIISLLGNLVSQDRHPFVKYAIKRFSHDLMLSMEKDSRFLSDIENWCRDAFEDQDTAFVEDILLLIELLPVYDIVAVASLSQFLCNSRMFSGSPFQLQATRILKKWDFLSRKFNNLTGAKATTNASSESPSGVKISSSSATDKPSRPPPNPKSNFRSRRTTSYNVQSSHTTRRSSPAYSSYHSDFRRDEVAERPPAVPRKQLSPRRNSSPRDPIRSKTVDEVGAERRSGNVGHFSRVTPYRAQGGRTAETTNSNSYHSRSTHDHQINRSSPHQPQSQRERNQTNFQQSYHDRRTSDQPYRYETSPESRPLNIDMLSSENSAASNRRPNTNREPSSHSFKRVDGYPEKGYYSDSEQRSSHYTARSGPVGKTFDGRAKTEYNKPRESGPSSYRSGAPDSRNSKYPYDNGASRGQRPFHSSSTNIRSVSPPHAVRSRSPHSYRMDERAHHEDTRAEDGSRDFRRYTSDANPKQNFTKDSHYNSSRGVKPPPRDDYREYRRDDDKDLRQSETRDYRQDLTRDFRQEDSESSRRNDMSRDFLSSKRKPDFKWSHDGPNKTMRLSDEERRDLVQKGACLYCRKPGHTIDNCRTRPARSSLPH